MFTCKQCNKVFSRKFNLKRHINTHSKRVSIYMCRVCYKEFFNEARATIHEKKCMKQKKIYKFCEQCQKNILTKNWNNHFLSNEHKSKSLEIWDNKFHMIKSAFKDRVITLVYKNNDESIIYAKEFFEKAKLDICNLIKTMLHKHGSIKFNFELFASYVKFSSKGYDDDDDEMIMDIKSFNSKMCSIYVDTLIEENYNEIANNIIGKMSEFQERDSGWSLIKINHLEININQLRPLKGSKYIDLPSNLKNKKVIVNVKNDDVYCFKWAIISALNPLEEHADRTLSYKIQNIESEKIVLSNGIHLDFTNMNFPMSVKNIIHFEKQNNTISINVFGYDMEHKLVIGPHYNTLCEKPNHINLLLLQTDSDYHYMWIKNISR